MFIGYQISKATLLVKNPTGTKSIDQLHCEPGGAAIALSEYLWMCNKSQIRAMLAIHSIERATDVHG
jgi:hypothetical protein